MEAVYFEDFMIRYSEGDRRGEVKLRSAFDFLQDAAAGHAALLGVGLNDLQARNMIWVLSRIKVAFSRPAAIGEKVRVKTWPNGFSRLFAARQFEVATDRGPWAEASSLWLPLDAAKLRPIKPELLAGLLPENAELPVFHTRLDKLPRIDAPELFRLTVRESMIDVNRHLNNAEYAAFAADAVNHLTGGKGRIAEIQLNYLAAQQEGAGLSIRGRLDDGAFRVEGITADGEACFQAAGRLC